MNKSLTINKLASCFAVCMLFVLGMTSEVSAQITSAYPYCQPSHPCSGSNGSCSPGSWANWNFKRIKLNTLDQQDIQCTNTAPSSGPYRYYNAGQYTTTLSPGTTYSVAAQMTTTNYPMAWAAWIDYNQNNSFDVNEAIALSPQVSPTSPPTLYTMTFTVPCSAKPGKTRVRFSCDYYNTWNASWACSYSDCYGESIDYDITISAPTAPKANFAIGDSIFVNSPVTFINSNQSGYISHQWSTSKDGFAAKTNKTNFNTSFATAGTYQVRLSSTNCNGTDITTKSITVYNPTAAPRADFLADRNHIPQDPTDLVVDEIVNLYDLSKGGATSWQWDITPPNSTGDWFWSTPYTEFDQNTQVFFLAMGSYDVCLTATNSIGSSQTCKNGYILIDRPVAAKFENRLGKDVGSSLDSGVLYDDGGPTGDYESNKLVDEYFTIDLCEATDLTLYVADGGFLNFYGNLEIYDGPDITYPLVKNWGGGGSSQTNITQTVVKMASHKATIRFWTQSTGYAGKGFEIRWKAHIANDGPLVADFDIKHMRNDTIYDCSGATTVTFTNKSHGSQDIIEHHWIFDYDPNIAYPSTYWDDPDNGDYENPTFTYYVAPKQYTVRLVEQSCEGWDTIVKSFYLNTTNMLPNIDFAADRRILEAGGSTKFKNTTVAGCDGTYNWDITPATGWSFINSTSATSEDIEVKFDNPGRYAVKLTATNANGINSVTRSDYIQVLQYCKPATALLVSGMSVTNVSFGSLNNTSALGDDGYQDFTKTVEAPVLRFGGTYPLSVTSGALFDMADRKVWIDYDHDGNFSATEQVVSSLNSSAPTVTTNITIPDKNGAVNDIVRMRVAITKAGQTLTACGPASTGEYEDYYVSLQPDDVIPVITRLGMDSIVIEVNTPYVDPGATAFDNLEGDITSKMVVDNTVDNTQPGIYVVTYNVKDKSGLSAAERRRYVFVKADLTAPTLTPNGGTVTTFPISLYPYVPYVDAGATAIDNPGAVNISGYVVTHNNVDDTKTGQYTVEYEVTDSYGNKTTATRTVNVKDITAPVLNLNGSDPYIVQVGVPFVDPTTATDNYDDQVRAIISSGQPVDANAYGNTYTITYTAKDDAGNVATPLTRTFIVGDLIKPTITSTGPQLMIVEVGDPYFSEPPVDAEDNFFKYVKIDRNAGGFNLNKIGTYTITYTATDKAGNVATWVRTIVVVDKKAPIVLAPAVAVERWTSFDVWSDVTVVDNYYAPVDFANTANGCRIEVVYNNVDVLKEGYYRVIYQAIDGSGNKSDLKERTVQVVANTTGIGNVEFGNAINVYPNPSTGKFEVEISAPVEGKLSISISNMTGQTIRTFSGAEIVNGKVSVDLSDIAAGVYFVNIQNENNVAIKKVDIIR